MTDLASVFLAPLQGLLSTFQSERHYQDDKKDEALLAIQSALVKTKQYTENADFEKCFDRNKEFEIAELWANASVKARHASSELASRLNDKSKYWQSKIEWSREEVLGKQIDFESLEKTVTEMLTSSDA